MGTVVQTSPYDTAGYILDLTRSLINDSAQSLAGSLLSNDQPYTFPLLNAAYRDLQDELANRGVETFAQEQILTLPAVPAAVQADPATRQLLSFTGFFDGVSTQPNPVLPASLIMPLRIQERPAGTFSAFRNVEQVTDGISGYRVPSSYLGVYDYLGDRIAFIGATNPVDILLRYMLYFPDLLDETSLMQLNRCDRALAALTAARFAQARGSPLADTFTQKAMMYIDDIANRTARRKQRMSRRRQPTGVSGL